MMEKRTLRAAEVLTVVHLVASLYAWLPPWVLGSLHQPSEPCVSYALLACREAIALVGTASSPRNSGTYFCEIYDNETYISFTWI